MIPKDGQFEKTNSKPQNGHTSLPRAGSGGAPFNTNNTKSTVNIPTVNIPTVNIPTVNIPTVNIPTVTIPTVCNIEKQHAGNTKNKQKRYTHGTPFAQARWRITLFYAYGCVLDLQVVSVTLPSGVLDEVALGGGGGNVSFHVKVKPPRFAILESLEIKKNRKSISMLWDFLAN